MEEELISVIIPVYNVEAYLEKCLESVINQTYKKLEIILIDDGSTDTSGKICDMYAQKDSRILVIHTPNQGLSGARNTGIQNAKGKYIGFIDSDDFIHRQFYEILYTVIKKQKADISICKFENFYKEESVHMTVKKEGDTCTYTSEEAIELLLQDKEITSHACNKLFKTELWKDLFFPNGKKFEDIAVAYKILEKSKKIVCIDQSMYAYRQRSSSILGNVTMELLKDYIEAIENRYIYLLEHYPKIKNQIVYSKINNLLRYHLITVGKEEIYNKPIMMEQHKELCKLTRNYKSYFKAKEVPLKFRILTYICSKNRNIFLHVTRVLYKIKKLKNAS